MIILCFLVVCGVVAADKIYAEDESPLAGKTIALDVGHGDIDNSDAVERDEAGAIGYCEDKNLEVYEFDVNLAVRDNLIALLEGTGAIIFEVPQLPTRRERVAEAEAANADILISIHHNGSLNTEMDYTETFITQTRFDKPLAEFIQPALVEALKLPNNGITNSGFGMTVFGDHPAVLTEAYFITNTAAACDFLESQARVQAEAEGLKEGILDYFSSYSEEYNPGKGPKS